MQIWNYYPSTGELLGSSTADANPVDEGAWIIPAHATPVDPGEPQPGRAGATTPSSLASKPTEGCMDIWDYDRKTGVLLGRSAADPNPEEPGAWLIPAYATTVRPPSVPDGCVAIFNGGLSAVGEWRIELDPDQVKVLSLKECAALSVLINSYVGGREDHDKARSAIMGVVEEMLEQDAAPDLSPADKKWVRDQVRALIRTLLDGKSAN